MNKILLIGAGNFGSPHLQGSRLVKRPVLINLADPFTKAREKAEKLFYEAEAEYDFEGELNFFSAA